MSSNRVDRIGMEIHRALAEVLREDISDPRVASMCSVVRTELSLKDLMYCGVYQRIRPRSRSRSETFSALIKATPFMGHQLGSRLCGIRRKMPELKLVPDDSIAYSVLTHRSAY